ncbi:MAG: anthranilate synthase component, partial [Actinomycetota bacterium]|nr:anthranilate synthase component [Actinomycetota bacterium]
MASAPDSSYRPSREEFERLARDFPVVPVWREILADFQTPVAAFSRLDPGPNGFLLESVEGGERWARYSFLGGDAFAVVRAIGGRIQVEGDPPVTPGEGESPLRYVKRLLQELRAPQLPGLPPFHGGAVGFIGYDCVREIERLPDEPPDDLGLPDLCLLLTRTFVVFDHLAQVAFVITNVPSGDEPGAAYEDATRRCDEVVEKLQTPVPAPTADLTHEDAGFSSTVSDEDYAAWVEIAKEHIYAGDVFQVVPSRRFEAALGGSAFNAYRVLRTINPSPYMYFLRFAAGSDSPPLEIAGSSPEPLVRVKGDVIVTRPIAGTRGRGATDEEDEALAQDL